MRFGGTSVMGSYHEKNQDSILAEKVAGGWLIAASDGVGCCEYSELGSALACDAAKSAILRFGGMPDDADKFFRELHTEWIKGIASLPEIHFNSECYATLLFCYLRDNRIFAARLGDGIVGIRTDGQNFLLFDDKKELLDNETECLFEEHIPEAWEVLLLEYDSFEGAVIATDGLSLVPHEKSVYNGFVNDLISGYNDVSAQDIVADMQSWLPHWESDDDKSIVFLMGEQNR